MKYGGNCSLFFRCMFGVRPKVSKWCKTTYTYLRYYIFYGSSKKYFITICSCRLEIVWYTVTHSSSIYNEFRGVISLLCICKKTNFLLPLSSFSFLHNFFNKRMARKFSFVSLAATIIQWCFRNNNDNYQVLTLNWKKIDT